MDISAPVMFEQYVVTADYQKKNKNDISLTAGDIIDVIERNDYGETQDKLFISPMILRTKIISQALQRTFLPFIVFFFPSFFPSLAFFSVRLVAC